MTKPFTASEVRIVAAHIGHYLGGGRAEAMLHAYADRLEADEKAVPAAWYVPSIISFKDVVRTSCPPEFQPELEGTVAWHASMLDDAAPVTDKFGVAHRPMPLYTHPSPADAERLAEALEIIDGWMELYDHQGTGSSRDASRSEKEWNADRAKLVALLGAHPTQSE